MQSVGSGVENRLVPSGLNCICPRYRIPSRIPIGGPYGPVQNCKICRRGSAPGRIGSLNVRESGCAAMRRFGGRNRYRPDRGSCDILRIPGHGSARRYSSVECDGMRRFATPSPVARDGAPVAQCRGPGLPRAPRETALYPVHCCHSSLPGRYASAAYSPACGGTTGNMPRIPGGGFLECCAMLRAGLVALRRFGVSVWFALVRFRGDLPAFGEFSKACNRHPGFTVLRFGVTCRPSRIVPRWHGMTYREYAAMRRYAPVRGFRYGSLWFGSPGVGGASLRVTFSCRWRNRA
jgi:hypothetical protein